MFRYKFVEASAQGLFRTANYQELIIENAKEGWRFVSAIPSNQNANGYIRTFALIFEREY